MKASVFKKAEAILRSLAEQNQDAGYGGVAEFLKQVGELPPEEISRLMERMDIMRAVVSLPSICKTTGEIKAFLMDLSPLPKPTFINSFKGDWISKMVKAEVNAWEKFAGWKIDTDKFAAVLNILGKVKAELLIAYGFEFGMLPDIVLTEDMQIPNWIKPEPSYWDDLEGGKLLVPDSSGNLVKLTEAHLSGQPIIFDQRCMPTNEMYNSYSNLPCWKDDLLMGHVIEKLQNENKLPLFGDRRGLGSRFVLNRFDYEKIALQLEQALEFPIKTFRLESTLEWNVLSQYKKGLPRSRDGETNTCVWLLEYFEDDIMKTLGSGSSRDGGLSDVGHYDSGTSWFWVSARLLGDLNFLLK